MEPEEINLGLFKKDQANTLDDYKKNKYQGQFMTIFENGRSDFVEGIRKNPE